MKQTRQLLHAVKQSIYLDVYGLFYAIYVLSLLLCIATMCKEWLVDKNPSRWNDEVTNSPCTKRSSSSQSIDEKTERSHDI